MEQIKLGSITVDVVKKNIKNTHLSVYPPTGRVRISAPNRMKLETIRVYVISKLGWIKKHQRKLRSQKREAPREYITRESHYYLGKRYLLQVVEHNSKPTVELKHSTIKLCVRFGADREKKKEVMEGWYREQLKSLIPPLITKWEKKLNVKVRDFGVKKMKTKWGTCNTKARRIWLNLELAKKPPEFLEYIVVHEIMHLIEKKHNDRFKSLMTQHMPKWRFYKDELNRSPLGTVKWD